VFRPYELANVEGSFWVEDPGLTIHFRLWGDEEPFGKTFEVTNKEQIFAPDKQYLGYIRVRDSILSIVPMDTRSTKSYG